MKTTLLDEEQFQATVAAPMRNVISEATDVLDVWPYVASIPPGDWGGHQVYDRFIECVYRDPTGRFDHVNVMTRTKDVYLVVVVDLHRDAVHGHHVLDLNEKYGLSGGDR